MGEFQAGFCSRTKGQRDSVDWHVLNCDPGVGWRPSPLVGTAGSECGPVLASFPTSTDTPDRTARRQGGGQRRHVCSVQGAEGPRRRARCSCCSFTSLCAVGQTPHRTPGCVCARVLAGWSTVGGTASCPAGNSSSETRVSLSVRGALAL